MDSIILPAPAKINLFLHITEERPDGYHNLQTAFQFLDWADTLTFEKRPDTEIRIHGNFGALPPHENIIYKAACALQALSPAPQGVDIYVDKQLPTGAGLGGGSSNAATTLIGLNALWTLNQNYMQLHEIGRALGADVPIFLFGQAAWAEGIGDILTPIAPPTPLYLLVIHPDKVSTAEFFRDSELTRNTQSIKMETFAWGEGRNDFEPVVLRRFSGVRQTFENLSVHGKPRMTGSGSAVFLPIASRAAGERLVCRLESAQECHICQGQNVSPLVATAQAYGINYSHWGVAKR